MTNYAFVLMGEYAVFPKDSRIHEVVTYGLQTCIYLVLRSSSPVAMAHIDNAMCVRDTIEKLCAKMQEKGARQNEMTAELIGGDFYALRYGSKGLSERIEVELKAKKIPYKYAYKGYGFTTYPALALALVAYYLTNNRSPLVSWSLAALGLVVGYILGLCFLSTNYFVAIDVASARADVKNIGFLQSGGVAEKVSSRVSDVRLARLNKRYGINPRNPDPALMLTDVSPDQ